MLISEQSRTSTPQLQSIPPLRRACTSAPPRSPFVDGYVATTHSYDDTLLHHNDILHHSGRTTSIDTSPYLPSTSSVSPDLDAETWGRQVSISCIYLIDLMVALAACAYSTREHSYFRFI